MNTYKTSDGKRVSQAMIDRKVRLAKDIKRMEFELSHGYVYCEITMLNESNTIIDVSHIISVKYAKETGRTELCWDFRNLRFLSRIQHEKHDAKTNLEREQIYIDWNANN